MKETDSSLYTAFKAKDTRFDGRFFVGILSTKIYCRLVCWAKQAKEENCTFFLPLPRQRQQVIVPAFYADRSLPPEIQS